MNNFIIFKEKYSNVFTEYGHGVDTIQHILESIGYNLYNLNSNEARKEGIQVIKELLKYHLIEITYLNGKPFNDNKLKLTEKISLINELWPKDQLVIDYEFIVNFKYQDWYLKKMREIPIDLNTDWKWFSIEFVPNMKEWIENNRPKIYSDEEE